MFKKLLCLFCVCTCFLFAITACSQEDGNNSQINTTQKIYKEAKRLGFKGSINDFVGSIKGPAPVLSNKANVIVADAFIDSDGKLLIVLSNNKLINCGLPTLAKIEQSNNIDALLEFVNCAQTYLDNVDTLYDNLISTDGFFDGSGFSYIECVDFYLLNKTLFADIKNNFAICKTLYKKISHTNLNEYNSNVTEVYVALENLYNSSQNLNCTAYDYSLNISTYLTASTQLLKNLKDKIVENSNVNIGQNTESFVPSANLKDFITTLTMLHFLFLDLDNTLSSTNNVFVQISAKAEIKKYVDNYYQQLKNIQTTLLNNYKETLVGVKIEETYTQLEDIYSVIYKNGTLTSFEQLLQDINNNLLMLTYFDININ